MRKFWVRLLHDSLKYSALPCVQQVRPAVQWLVNLSSLTHTILLCHTEFFRDVEEEEAGRHV